MWLKLGFEAYRALVRVLSIQHERTPEQVIDETADFRQKITVPENYRGQLELLSGEVYQRFGQFVDARKIYEDERARFANLDLLVSVEALNREIESYIIEGYSKKGDALDVDLKVIAENLKALDAYTYDSDALLIDKQEARLKAVLVCVLRVLAGNNAAADFLNELLKQIGQDLQSLPRETPVRAIYALLVQQPLEPTFVEQYLKTANALTSQGDRNEMLFWLGMKLLYLGRKDEARAYFERILDEDVLLEHWYSRFLNACPDFLKSVAASVNSAPNDAPRN
jgi:hypothetical protein